MSLKPKNSPPSNPAESVRLQKFLSNQGICSRREAEVLIEEGRVKVNGQVATIGQQIDPATDRVMVGRRSINPTPRESITLALYKPRGVLCSHHDPHHERTVFDYIPAPWNREKLIIAGRLDKESDGLLILTSDGELANRLTHPSHRVVKRYRILLTRPFNPVHLPKLLEGVHLEGEFLRADKIIRETHGPDADKRLEIHLEHGRKREIRRLLEHFGYFVKRLTRFQIGALTTKGLSPGRARPLSTKEVSFLFE